MLSFHLRLGIPRILFQSPD